MADYKDIIKGTLNNIAVKVKEVAESDTVQNFCGKVKEAAETGSVKEIYDKGANRAKAYSRIAKLTLEMNGESEELKRVYTEIGKLYYDQAKDAPEGFFAPLFNQVQEISASILAKEEEINAMKAEFEAEAAAKDIEVEVCAFDEVVDATENDGTNETPADDKTEE